MHPNKTDPVVGCRLGKLDRSFEPIGQRHAATARAVELAETMREILFRDGSVTEAALICEGYTATEIVEHAEEARRLAGLVLAVAGRCGADRMPEIVAKAIAAKVEHMPVTAGWVVTNGLHFAWSAYCDASAAHRLDPWVSQSERCLHRLKDFLVGLPLLPRETNQVVQAVAGELKRRVQS